LVSRDDYAVLGLDQWNGNASSVRSFKRATGVSFPLLLDASGVVADYKTTYDRLVLVDKDGLIAFSGSKVATADIQTVKKKIQDLISE
jgi:hypothetical protein